MRLSLALVVVVGGGVVTAGAARADAPRTGLYLFEGNLPGPSAQTFDRAMAETVQSDSRVRFVPIAAAKPDPKAIEAELGQADNELSLVEAAFSEMNLGKARTLTDQAIAVYERNIVELAARPTHIQPLRNAWIKAARVRFFDGDEPGAKQAVQRALALDGKLTFSTELFPLPMKNLVTEAKKAFDHAGHGKVTLESQPLGATVYLNGKPLPNRTPTEIVGVGAGPNYVRFEKAGFQPFSATVNVAGAASGSYSSTTLTPAGGRLPAALDAGKNKVDTAPSLPGVKDAMADLGLDLLEFVRLEKLDRTDGPPIHIAAYTYSAKLDKIVKKVDRRVNESELDQTGRLLARELLSGGVLEGKVEAPPKPTKPTAKPSRDKPVVAPVTRDRGRTTTSDDDKIAGLDKPVFWGIVGGSIGVVLVGVGLGVGLGLSARNGWIAQQNGTIVRLGLTF